MRLGASAFVTSLLVAVVFAADAPPEPPARPPEPAPKSEDTPEAAVRRMIHALVVGDRKELGDSILPVVPELEEFLESLGLPKPASPEDRKALESWLAKPRRTLKAGDVFTRADGRESHVKPEEVGPDKALVLESGHNVPWPVVRTEKGWRVDVASYLGQFDIPLGGRWSFNEIARVTSPSGRLDAVLVETNGGATTAFGYEVHVVEKGKKTVRDGRAALVYGGAGVNLRWEKDRVIAGYLNCRWTDQKDKTVTVAGEKVEVELRSGVDKEKPKQP